MELETLVSIASSVELQQIAIELIRSTHHSQQNQQQRSPTITIDGRSLSLAQLITTSHLCSGSPQNKLTVKLTDDQQTLDGIDQSLQFMLARTSKSTYGVTTGFGAAATTRTDQVESLQISVIEHLLAGVTGFELNKLKNKPNLNGSKPYEAIGEKVMSESIVRGAILIRLNSLSRGHSAVRVELLDGLINLLNHAITPLVPLRGTISASGDLSPLAYIAGTLCAHPAVLVIDRSVDPPELKSCQESLKSKGLKPLVLGPKEGLAIANGTAFSASAAGIAIYQSHVLLLLSQVLTVMMAEAMLGQIGAFHPFIHQTARPHPGQVAVAETIFKLLKTSKFIDQSEHLVEKELEEERVKQQLRQDRYPIRTAAQWLGPQLEDLAQSHRTIVQELNSTTDNPLIDVKNGILHHGGNFQASSMATCMEKTRLSLALIGKLMFSQMTELNNAYMNRGLPSCLNGSEPSTNYHTKGLDTSSAAYCAELQYLANPVTNHVQSAEGHNQSVNSLAFLSARKTLESIEVLKLLMASHLYCLCQAIDLRLIEIKLKDELEKALREEIIQEFEKELKDLKKEGMEEMIEMIVEKFWSRREQNSSLDNLDRIKDSLEASLMMPLIQKMKSIGKNEVKIDKVENLMKKIEERLIKSLERYLNEVNGEEEMKKKLSIGGFKMYELVRKSIGIKFRRGDVFNKQVDGISIGDSIGMIVNRLEIGGEIEKVLIEIF